MVLDSQRGRIRSYGASPKKAHGRWGWGLLILVLALGGLAALGYLWPSRNGSLQPASADPSGDVPAPPPAAAVPSSGTPTAAASPAPREPAHSAPAAPVAPNVSRDAHVPVAPRPASSPATGAASQPAASAAATQSASAPAAAELLNRGMKLVELGNLVEGRRVLSLALSAPGLDPGDAQAIRDTLTSVNRTLVFSSKVVAGDPLVEVHVIQAGDYLSRIAPRHHVTFQFLEIINRTPANRVRLGQKLKIVKGPFEAVVSKSEFRMDLFVTGSDGARVYIRSFPVGLGEADSTPLGRWLIKTGGKVPNPAWTNPRTNESFAPDDPKNPIGKYWLALEGLEERNKKLQGYGIHGTIDPDSIGKQASMGCVRLRDDDLVLVYSMLVEGQSEVSIVP